MASPPPAGYREPSPPLLRSYRLRLRGWHLLALGVTIAGISITVAAIRYGVVALPCIVVWIPGLFYALTSSVRRVTVYANRVEIVRMLRPRLQLPLSELELRQWPYGVELVASGEHVKLVPASFASRKEFDDFVEVLSGQLERHRLR